MAWNGLMCFFDKIACSTSAAILKDTPVNVVFFEFKKLSGESCLAEHLQTAASK